jgi:hypothetical protein
MYHKAVLSVLLNSSLTSWQVWRFGHGAGILDHGPAIIELQRVCGDCSDFSVIVRRKTLQTVAAFDFLAENEDELSLHAGEKVQVMGFVNDDWANVQNLHGDHGVVPQSYLESFE